MCPSFKGFQSFAFERKCEKMQTMVQIKVVLMRMAIMRQGARISLIILWNERIFLKKLLTRSNFVKTTNIVDLNWYDSYYSADAKIYMQQRRRLNSNNVHLWSVVGMVPWLRDCQV